MLGYWRMHSCGTTSSEMSTMFDMRKDESSPAATDHLVSRQTDDGSMRGCSWTCVTCRRAWKQILVARGSRSAHRLHGNCARSQPRESSRRQTYFQTLDSVGRTHGERGWESLSFLQKNFRCQGLRCKPQQPVLRGRRVESSKRSPPSRKWRVRRFCNSK